MARTGGNPNIAEAGKKTQFGADSGYSAVKAAEKSHEARRANGMLSADLKGRLDEQTIKEINTKIISMAKKGNLKAYELIRDGIGEKPNEKVDLSIEDESARLADDYFTARYNRGTDK